MTYMSGNICRSLVPWEGRNMNRKLSKDFINQIKLPNYIPGKKFSFSFHEDNINGNERVRRIELHTMIGSSNNYDVRWHSHQQFCRVFSWYIFLFQYYLIYQLSIECAHVRYHDQQTITNNYYITTVSNNNPLLEPT